MHRWPLFFGLTACCSNLARCHQVTNVFLQELVVVIQLVVLLSDGFDAVEYRDQ